MAWKPLWRGSLYGVEAFMAWKPLWVEAFLALKPLLHRRKPLWLRSFYGTEALWFGSFFGQKPLWHRSFLGKKFFAGFFGCVWGSIPLLGHKVRGVFCYFHVGGNLDALYSWWTVRTTARALACNSRPKWPIVLRSWLAGKAESGWTGRDTCHLFLFRVWEQRDQRLRGGVLRFGGALC